MYSRFFYLSLVFLLFCLSVVRMAFIGVYAPESTAIFDIWTGLQRGFRFDLKWSAIALLPALLFLILGSVRKSPFIALSKAFLYIGAGLVFTLSLINFGFYGFYGSPINSIIFGFVEDDTWAVIVSILKDWPVFQYVLCLILFFWGIYWIQSRFPLEHSPKTTKWGHLVFLTVFLVVATRGSFSTFPLRQMDLNVTPDVFVNQSVNTGAQAFYDAVKERKAMEIGKNPLSGLLSMGFKSQEEALSALTGQAACHTKEESHPHIIVAVMESMGRDLFETHDRNANNVLGKFEEAMREGDLFLNALSIENGTFATAEGLLFNTPISPISQSKYGYRSFPFSQVFDFKKAGYKTVFLTSGKSSWRNMETNFPRHGFDAVIGESHLMQKYGDIPSRPWGVPDEYMFDYAKGLIKEAEKKGETLFLVMLSTTNHPPYETPRNYEVRPINYDSLPIWKTKDETLAKSILETYQYASNALGQFLATMPKQIKEKTIVVATGDHNTRSVFEYPDSSLMDHQFGVPLYFQVPARWRPSNPNLNKWVSHFDIFPTLRELVLHKEARFDEGFNVYSDCEHFALSFTYAGTGRGLAVSDNGAVIDFAHPKYFERDSKSGRLVAVSSPSVSLRRLCRQARSKMALADYRVRKGCIEK